MPVVPAVVAVALLCGIVAFVESLRRPHDAFDPDAEADWVVRRLGRRPHLVRFVRRRLDRTTAFGFTLTVLFTIAFVSALAIGALADMVTRHSGFARWDRAVAQWGADHVTPSAASALRVVTQFGSSAVVVSVAVVAAVLAGRPGRRAGPFVFLTTVVAGQLLLSNLVKVLVGRPRPDVARFVAASGPSFPSGHSTAAAAAWAAVAFVLTRGSSRRVRAIAGGVAVTIAVAVGATRALLGAHWLTDVLAGFALGWGWFLAVAVAMGGRALRAGAPAERVAHRRLPATPGARASQLLAPPRTLGAAAAKVGLGVALFVAVGTATGWILDAVASRMPGRADEHVNVWFAHHRDVVLDRVTAWLSSLGSTPVVVIVTLLAAAGLARATRSWRAPARLALGLGLELTSFLAVVTVVNRSRPTVVRLDPSPPTSSYPSGHTAAAVALYVGLALVVVPFLTRRWQHRAVVGAAVAIATAVAVARVYRGMHHPSDVLAGGALGSACVWWARRIVPDAEIATAHDVVLDAPRSITVARESRTPPVAVHTGGDVRHA